MTTHKQHSHKQLQNISTLVLTFNQLFMLIHTHIKNDNIKLAKTVLQEAIKKTDRTSEMLKVLLKESRDE